MRSVEVAVALALAFATMGLETAGAAPLSAYGRLPSIEAAAVSPRGGLVALIATDGERRAVVIHDVAADRMVLRADAGAVKIRAVRWVGEERLLILTTVTSAPAGFTGGKSEFAMAHLMDVASRKLTGPLLEDTGHRGMNVVFGLPVVREHRGRPAIYTSGAYILNWRIRTALYRIDPETGRSTLIDTGEEDTVDWVVGPDGEPVAQEAYHARSGEWALKLRAGPGWRKAVSVTALTDIPSLLGLGRDGRSVLYSIREDGVWKWRESRLDDGPVAEPIETLGHQMSLRDPQDGRLIGHYALVGDEHRWVFFDPADARAWSAVRSVFPGDLVTLVSWSADRRKILVLVDSPKEGPAYALVDLDARKATWLGSLYPDLAAPDVSPRRPIRFTAADGLPLTGYLTLPAGRPAKALPLIVFPHGGPAARDTPGFDWWAQGMASRGYAVLQVNFRGSDGLGSRHLEAGYGQWGRKMQTDLSDGVRHLAAEGIVDPRRVCIVGASYGGYAALAGATIDRGVYRCAVAVSGLSDLRRMVEDENRVARRYWKRFMGVESLRDPALAEISPITHAAKVEIPILMIHGRDDTVVPMEQSQIMADALRRHGKPHELILQKGEDHWLSRGETRLQTLTAAMAFIEKHNPPD